MRTRKIFEIILILISMLICSAPARADAPWRIVVKASGTSNEAAARVRREADRLMEKAAKFIGHQPAGPYFIIIASSEDEFNRSAGEGAPEWAVAIYSQNNRTIVLRPEGFRTNPANFFNVLQHELVHAVLDHKFRGRPNALPRWLNEGLAVYFSDAWEYPEEWSIRKSALYKALKDGNGLDFEDIQSGFPYDRWLAQLAYTQSFDFVQYLIRTGGEKRMRRLLEALTAGGSLDSAFKQVYKASFADKTADWRNAVRSPGPFLWLTIFLASFDIYIWAAIALLAIAGAIRVRSRWRHRSRPSTPAGYDPEDDWDELDEEWDPDTYGHRPWRPGRRN